jgi:hypothetical protein
VFVCVCVSVVCVAVCVCVSVCVRRGVCLCHGAFLQFLAIQLFKKKVEIGEKEKLKAPYHGYAVFLRFPEPHWCLFRVPSSSFVCGRFVSHGCQSVQPESDAFFVFFLSFFHRLPL